MLRLPSRPVLTWQEIAASARAFAAEHSLAWIEAQAEEFASYLLAPEAVFEPFLTKQLSPLDRLDASLESEDVLPYLANPVGEHFGLSNSAAQARIRKSEQWRRFADRLNGRPGRTVS